mgnify:CR=1 FL=1
MPTLNSSEINLKFSFKLNKFKEFLLLKKIG